jgi:hypothetical protein
MAVPYTFGTATAAIPLSQLDNNFATAITLGNTAVYLGNTTTSIGNLTLTNVTISSGSVTITDTTVSGNVTLSGGTANGVAYLNGSKVLTTGSALTFDGTTFTSGAHTLSTGNLNFSSTAQRITGDFSNATIANRVAFQSSTTNGNTQIVVFPNGTATNSGLDLYSNSDPTNTSRGLIRIDTAAVDFKIDSTRTGTGTYLPITFYTSGGEKVRIDTSGNVGIGATANASAILDAQSTTKGVRMPNMTTTQKNAISSPAAGLIVFDTTLAKLCVYSGSAWQTVTSV